MGQGEESRAEPSSVEIQERGEIFFFYRPKVNKEEAHGSEDVQRLYLVLRPESGERSVEEKQDPQSGKEGSKSKQHDDDVQTQTSQEANQKDEEETGTGGGHGSQKVNIEKQALLRFIVMGRKSLPEYPTDKSRPYWGFVEMVTTKIEHVKDALKGGQYDTSSRGHRHVADSRGIGEGVYRILRHNQRKMHTHLVYKLEFPREGEEDEPQKALNIAREASFLIQIKNPQQHQHQGGRGGFRGLSNKRKAAYPAHLQGLFGHNRFHPADPPDFLNYEGCEFLLISASDDIEKELGLQLKQEDQCSDLVKTFGDNAAAAAVSTRPLFHGIWA